MQRPGALLSTSCGKPTNCLTVSWGSIHAARTCRVFTLPYLRVYSGESRKVIWLPLFLADYRRFAELVAESAGDGHPVTREVWRRIEEDT